MNIPKQKPEKKLEQKTEQKPVKNLIKRLLCASALAAGTLGIAPAFAQAPAPACLI